ncbi:MAG: hypothetical protein NTZ50_01495, partial [Chloroflexi bacterium]|nr:hypothetical protein [Chloroflexota bacterium]
MTVTAENGVATRDYVVTVTRTEGVPLSLQLAALWPNTGLPEGGMPVALLGSGFVSVTAVRVDGTAVDT